MRCGLRVAGCESVIAWAKQPLVTRNSQRATHYNPAMRKFAVLVVIAALSMSAAPAKKRPVSSLAPDAVPHSIALFLGSMSRDGGRQVTFKATAVGMRFFFEEPAGVTVYRFDRGQYIKEEFLRGYVLDRAVKRYAKK